MKKIIEIDLDNKFEYINDYDDTRINDLLLQYVLNSITDDNNDILLRVKFNYDIDRKGLENVEEVFKKSFSVEYNKLQLEIKKQNIRDFFLLVLGFLFLIIYCFLDDFNVFLIAEFFMVISWVAFWEFAESLLFVRRKLIGNRKKIKNLIDAMIEIID